MKNLACFLLSALWVSVAGSTLSYAAGTTAASFLDIPVGARPAAMGDAYVALASDGYAVTDNPAGLGMVHQTELAGQHLSYLESIQYEHASLVQPLGRWGAVGVAAQYLGTGDIPLTDNLGQTQGSFSSHYAAYSLAYGRSIMGPFSIGGTFKWIDAKIAGYSANTVAFDVGGLYQPTPRLGAALTVNNAGPGLKFIGESDPLPLAVHAGAFYRPIDPLLVSTEGVFPRGAAPSGRLGLEWAAIPMLAVRVGYRSDSLKGLSPLAGFSTGIGIRVWGQEFAYAWLPYGELGSTQYFSLQIRLGPSSADTHVLQKP